MKTTTAKGSAVWKVVLLIALLIQPTLSAQAEDSQVKGTMVLTPKEGLGVPRGEGAVLASGAAEDTLTTCMARIPVLASAGQRMLAEQTCASEEMTRKAIRSAPKF